MILFVFFFKQKTAYELRISDWRSDVCSSDLLSSPVRGIRRGRNRKSLMVVLCLRGGAGRQRIAGHTAAPPPIDRCHPQSNGGSAAELPDLDIRVDRSGFLLGVDRKSVVEGKGGSGRGDLGGARFIKQKKK